MATRTMNIVLLFNGTGDDSKDKYVTNVVKMDHGLINDPEKNQITIYLDGIANDRQWHWLFRWFSYYTGFGAGWVEKQAYEQLKHKISEQLKELKEGDSIDFQITTSGFSRGAALARDFMNQFVIKKLRSDLSKTFSTSSFSIKPFAQLLYDTVSAFGIPINIPFFKKIGIFFQNIDLGFDFSIPNGVHAIHAVAINEKREAFKPKLVNYNGLVEEVWFASNHKGVGGGHEIPEGVQYMADEIPLRYLSKKAQALGLLFHEDFVEAHKLNSNDESPLGLLHDPELDDQFPNYVEPREIYVKENNEKSNRLPIIHQSVIDRIQSEPNYRPEGVLKLKSFYVLSYEGEKMIFDEAKINALFTDKALDADIIALSANDPTYLPGAMASRLKSHSSTTCEAETPAKRTGLKKVAEFR